jgi:DNA-binding response OmpR family regulator
MVRHEGQEAALTGREFQLPGFLLDHPHRFSSVDKIRGQAWTDPGISPEQVRNYVLRIRRILARLERLLIGLQSRRVAHAGEEDASGLERLAG